AGARPRPGRFHGLGYEALVVDGSRRLGELFDFLGVPTPPDAGRFLRVPENLGAARGADRVIAANRQKWKRSMPPALRRRIEGVTADLLDTLGYEREHPDEPPRRLSAAQLAAYRALDGWRHLRRR